MIAAIILNLAPLDGSIAVVSRSGATRLWLIDYYTKAFAKAKEAGQDKTGITPELLELIPGITPDIPVKRKTITKADLIPAKIERQVAKAERDIADMSRQIRDVEAAQAFVASLLAAAQQYTSPIYDFKLIENAYNDGEDDLLLFAAVL